MLLLPSLLFIFFYLLPVFQLKDLIYKQTNIGEDINAVIHGLGIRVHKDGSVGVGMCGTEFVLFDKLFSCWLGTQVFSEITLSFETGMADAQIGKSGLTFIVEPL
jgi:hypothetical protein